MTDNRRVMALTAELVARCHRPEPDRGPELQYEYFEDADYQAAAEKLLSGRPVGPLWLFAYGSLIWKPDVPLGQQRRARAHGWHRSFCMSLTRWRGSPEQPGLMMCLDRGGSCEGVIFRLSESDALVHVNQLLQREIGSHEALDSVRWITVRSGHETLRALTFYAKPSLLDNYVGRWPLEKVAHNLARACGHVGSGAEYLYRTVSKLEELGIRDRRLWRLQELVAGEIAAMQT